MTFGPGSSLWPRLFPKREAVVLPRQPTLLAGGDRARQGLKQGGLEGYEGLVPRGNLEGTNRDLYNSRENSHLF